MRTSVPFLLLAAALPAQNRVTFPSDHTSRNGAGLENGYPLAAGVNRCQFLYESWDLGVPDQAAITKLGFRRDENYASTGKTIVLRITMGASNQTAASSSATFANNYKGAPVQVFAQKNFALPNLNVAPPPLIHEVWIPLDVPYTYTKADNLLVDYYVSANSNGNAAFPYYLDRANFYSPVTSFGQGCPTSASKIPALASRPTAIGSTWYTYLTNAPASSPTALLLDVAQQPTINLAFIGAPACNLYVGTSAPLVTTTNASGGTSWNLQVPNDLAYYGSSIYSQTISIDYFVSGSVALSNGDRVVFGAEPRMTRLYSLGTTTATTGNPYRNDGLVSLFEY